MITEPVATEIIYLNSVSSRHGLRLGKVGENLHICNKFSSYNVLTNIKENEKAILQKNTEFEYKF